MRNGTESGLKKNNKLKETNPDTKPWEETIKTALTVKYLSTSCAKLYDIKSEASQSSSNHHEGLTRKNRNELKHYKNPDRKRYLQQRNG